MSSAMVLLWFLFFGLTCIAAVVGQILLALAVYHNAKSRCNPNPAMWGLLTGFLGWIPAVIYYVMRDSARNRLMVCPHCQAAHPVCFSHCPQCGAQNSYSEPFSNPYTQQEAKTSKNLLIAAIVLLGVSFLVGIFLLVFLVALVPDAYFYARYYW